MQHIYDAGIQRRSRAGVPRTIAHGQAAEHQHLLQELVNGQTLATHIDNGEQLPTLRIMRDLLDTVTDMEHQESMPDRAILGSPGSRSDFSPYGGIVYLDLKPANIIYDIATGDTYIVDGGTARGSLERDDKPGTAIGTAMWMAPEQCVGRKEFLQTNQYQLALIWLELRTNGGYSKMRALMNESGSAYTYMHQTSTNAHWNGMKQLMMDHDIPEEEQRIMLRALQHHPEQRWESTGAMLDALVEYMMSPTPQLPVTPQQPRIRHIGLIPLEIPDEPTRLLASIPRSAAQGRAR